MRQLEERLGVRLLHRTTRSVSVTDTGRRLLDRLRPAIDQIAGALENLDQERIHPMGHLRVYVANQMAATAVIVPVWERFYRPTRRSSSRSMWATGRTTSSRWDSTPG